MLAALLLILATCELDYPQMCPALGTFQDEYFDLVEINHYHNEYGDAQFVQLIFWNWKSLDNKFHIDAWVLAKDGYDKSDPEHRKAWEDEVHEWAKRFSLRNKQRHVAQRSYPGKYVCGRHRPVFVNGFWTCYIHQDRAVPKKVMCKWMRETWTQYDPERDDKVEYPDRVRLGFRSERAIEEWNRSQNQVPEEHQNEYEPEP